jgi:Na+-translocating ferredoxin:NAD+ oxidoreductase RnfG subunit
MIASLLKTAIGRYVGIAVGAALLSGMVYAGCMIKNSIQHEAKVEAQTAQKTLEVEREDQKVKEQVHQMDDDALGDFLRRGGVRKDR